MKSVYFLLRAQTYREFLMFGERWLNDNTSAWLDLLNYSGLSTQEKTNLIKPRKRSGKALSFSVGSTFPVTVSAFLTFYLIFNSTDRLIKFDRRKLNIMREIIPIYFISIFIFYYTITAFRLKNF